MRRAFILPHLRTFVKNFFQIFSIFFVLSSRAFAVACCCRNGFTCYHTFQPLSRTFFDFFQNLLSSTSAAVWQLLSSLTASIDYHTFPLLSILFFKFFKVFLLALYLRSPRLFTHKMCPSPQPSYRTERRGQGQPQDQIPGGNQFIVQIGRAHV